MNTEFMKKYTIIKSVIDSTNVEFTCDKLFIISSSIANKYDIAIDYMDIINVITTMYNNFEIDRHIGESGNITYFKNSKHYKIEDTTISR